MELIRCTIAAVLLVCSSHALALFMPEGFSINADNEASSEEGCGVLTIENSSKF